MVLKHFCQYFEYVNQNDRMQKLDMLGFLVLFKILFSQSLTEKLIQNQNSLLTKARTCAKIVLHQEKKGLIPMATIEHFAAEIAAIQNIELRDFVEFFLEERTPAYFWTCGASSSGKYHPKFSQGEGGLVRHTRAACILLEECLRLSPFCYLSDKRKDYARVAMILHDTRKYGRENEIDKTQFANHAVNAAAAVENAWREFFDNSDGCPEFLLSAIQCHMGQWSEPDYRPFTNIDRAVHMADYWASRSMIEIPGLMEDWERIEGVGAFAPDDLPFEVPNGI